MQCVRMYLWYAWSSMSAIVPRVSLSIERGISSKRLIDASQACRGSFDFIEHDDDGTRCSLERIRCNEFGILSRITGHYGFFLSFPRRRGTKHRAGNFGNDDGQVHRSSRPYSRARRPRSLTGAWHAIPILDLRA